MIAVRLRLLLVLTIAAGAAAPLRGDDTDINPQGKWPKYAIGQPKRVLLWHSENAWHIRTTTKPGEKVDFTGTVKIVGGSMTNIGGFGGLEKGKGKKVKDADWGKWNKEKTELTFKFTTNGKEDGFDFAVSDDAEAVIFSLKVDGFFHPQEVFIGRQGAHPKADNFSLPARPGAKK